MAQTTLRLLYKGFNYVDYIANYYTMYDTLSDVAATGANSVALTPDYGIDVADSTIYAGNDTTDSIADLTKTIQEANADGLTSFVRPLIDFFYPQESTADPGTYYVPDFDSSSDPNGYEAGNVPAGVTPATVPAAAYTRGHTANYRGELSPNDINITTFFGSPTQVGSYDKMIVDEAKAAQAAGAKMFSIGTELDSLVYSSDSSTNAKLQTGWDNLIADVRAVFSGKLTYSANWAQANKVQFWNKLDYVGIDGYVPLSNNVADRANDNNPSEASLVAGWTNVSNVTIAYSGGTTVGEQLGGVSAIKYFDTLAQQSISKQFIFSEIGYQNDTGAAADPTGGSNQGVADPSLQAELYQAFFDAWGGAQQIADANGGDVDGVPYALAGAYFWNWNPDTSGQDYDDWSPKGYPAATAITAGYTPPGPELIAQKGSASVAGSEGEPGPSRGTAGTSGTGVLAGDKDTTNSPMTVTAVAGGTVGSVSPTTYGSVTIDADGSYVYFADASKLANAPVGVPAQDEIQFTVTDGNGLTETSTLTVTDYRDPTAGSVTASVAAGATVTGTAGASGTGLLHGASDPDGLTPSVGSVLSRQQNSDLQPGTDPDAGSYGTLTYNANGSYSYVANDAASLAQDQASNGGGSLTDGYVTLIDGAGAAYGVGSFAVSVTLPAELVDTVANVQTYLSGLEADVTNLTSITATGGSLSVSVAVFNADREALDKVVGGFAVTDTAADVAGEIGGLPTFAADTHLKAITVSSGSASVTSSATLTAAFNVAAGATVDIASADKLTLSGKTNLSGTFGGPGSLAIGGGSATLMSGANLSVGTFGIAGSGTSVTLAEALTYSGVFGEGAGTVVSIASADKLTLSGKTSTLAGTMTGLGTLLFGGGAATLMSGAGLSVGTFGIAGLGTSVTFAEALTYSGSFSEGIGSTLSLTAGTLALMGHASFAGATVNGSHTLYAKGTTTISGLTIGGTAIFENTKTLTQSGGTVTVGDTSTSAATLYNGTGGIYDITDNSGVAHGSLTWSGIKNAGIFEKTGGTGTSMIVPNITNIGTIMVSDGVLELKGVISGAGNASIHTGATLEFDAAVVSTQVVSFSASGGTLLLDAAASFAGTVAGFGSGDTLDIGHFGTGTTATYSANAKNTGGTLAIKTGTTTANLKLVGAYVPTGFHVAAGKSGDTLVTYAAPQAKAAEVEAKVPASETSWAMLFQSNLSPSHAASLISNETHAFNDLAMALFDAPAGTIETSDSNSMGLPVEAHGLGLAANHS